MTNLIVYLIVFNCFACSIIKGQSDSVLYRLEKKTINNLTELEAKKNKRFNGGIANTFLNFYQNYLSIQFSADCIYYPSCAGNSREAFQKYGFIKSILISADRNTRCSGWIWRETPNFLISDDGHIIDRP